VQKATITLELADWEASQVMWALEFVREDPSSDEQVAETCAMVGDALREQMDFGRGDQQATFCSPSAARIKAASATRQRNIL